MWHLIEYIPASVGMEDFVLLPTMSLIVLDPLVAMFSPNLCRFFLIVGMSGEKGKIMC